MLEEYKMRVHQLTLLNEIAKHLLCFSDYNTTTTLTNNLIKEYTLKIDQIQQEYSNAND